MNRFLLIKSNPKLIKSQKRFLHKRFFYENLKTLKNRNIGYEFDIDGNEFNHIKSSRVKQGEDIELFDKDGSFILCNVKKIDKKSSKLVIKNHILKIDDNNNSMFTLAVGMPKGGRSDWLVEKATELGVHQIIPLETKNVINSMKDTKLDRWERLIIQACKQSHTSVIPKLREKMTIDQVIENEISEYDLCLWGCIPNDPKYKPIPLFNVNTEVKPKNLLLIIGPEGDFSIDEKDRLVSKNAIPVSLSKNILRTETAAITLLTGAVLKWNI